MATNPMQRRARNAFLLGMVIAVVIAAAPIAFLFMRTKNLQEEIDTSKSLLTSVYVLNQDVKSGQTITSDMFSSATVTRAGVPANATSDIITTLSDYALSDKAGNKIYTDKAGLYKTGENRQTRIFFDEALTYTDSNGTTKTEGWYYTINDSGEITRIAQEIKEENNTYYYTKSGNNNSKEYIKKDDAGYYKSGESNKIRVFKEEKTDNYYEMQDTENGETKKEYVELAEKPLIAKIDLKTNTIITTKYLARSDEMTTDDTRTQAYNMIVLPADLSTGDFVDIRIRLQDGRDYIVLSKKEVDIPVYNGTYSTDTMNLTIREEELLVLSSAIIDAYKIEGSELYAIKYVEPGNQQSATPTYTPSAEIISLMSKDPNILAEAKTELARRYNSNNTRAEIQSKITNDDTSVVTGVQESITKTQEERQKYLDSLAGGAESDY